MMKSLLGGISVPLHCKSKRLFSSKRYFKSKEIPQISESFFSAGKFPNAFNKAEASISLTGVSSVPAF